MANRTDRYLDGPGGCGNTFIPRIWKGDQAYVTCKAVSFHARQLFDLARNDSMNIQQLLDKSASKHSHLCPRQVLGVRLGLAGMTALGFDSPPDKKQLLVITETDGCFVDGLSAATNCTVGHRTLRVEDYGKVAAVFVDVKTGRAIRIAPALDIRERADAFISGESDHYAAQLQVYQTMPDKEMFTCVDVQLVSSLEAILSRPGMRVNCGICGEEIMNEREVHRNNAILCRACAHGGYYRYPGQEAIVSCTVDQEITQ
jgi:formylmethanofuran dehydrogenase subunit E